MSKYSARAEKSIGQFRQPYVTAALHKMVSKYAVDQIVKEILGVQPMGQKKNPGDFSPGSS